MNQEVDIELNDPQSDMVESTAQRNLMHCAIGSGKTFTIGLISADFILNNPEVRGFIGANTYSQLSKSTLDGVFRVWENKFKLKREIDYVSNIIPPKHFKTFGPKLDDYNHTISFSNGAFLFTASLDNYKVIDGTEFGWACLDETKDTKEEAAREVIIARLRQIGMFINSRGNLLERKEGESFEDFKKRATDKKLTGFNPLYVFTSPAKTDWLAEWFDIPDYFEEINASIFSETDYFRKRKGDKLVVISSAYHNKHNLSEGFIDRLIEDNKHNLQRIDMLVYGSPLAKTGGEYFPNFNRLVHIKKMDINPKLPVHISLDFNLYPYVTLMCYQTWFDEVLKKWIVYKFDEICMESPKNTTEDACDELLNRYEWLLKNGLYYYGDYSGKTHTTNSKEHNYEVLEKILKKYIGAYSDKVIVNDKIDKRKNFMNKVLAAKSENVPIEFYQAPHCKKSINEYEYLKEDPNGSKLKQMVTDEVTKKSYQKYGHIADADEYFFTSAFSQFYNN